VYRTRKAYYKILEVQPQASPEAVDVAYRRLARLYHPDLNPGKDSTLQMQELNEAYGVLRDPQKRREYDLYLTEQAKPRSNPSSASNSASNGASNSGFNGAFNGNKAVPTTCQKCGRSDASLRIATFPYVISLLFITIRRGNGGLYCSDCRRQEMDSAKMISFFCGWWGIPFGIFYTLASLFAPSEGVIDAKVNANYLRLLGAYFIHTGNLEQAKKAIKASLDLNFDPQLAKAASSLFKGGTNPTGANAKAKSAK